MNADDSKADDTIAGKTFTAIPSRSGSHQKMKNLETGRTTIVPVHTGVLGKGLEHKILKQAGLLEKLHGMKGGA